MSHVEEWVPSQLWVNGRNNSVAVVWASPTHAELVVGADVDLCVGQLTALVVGGFLSLPMRAELRNGRHVLLRFVQPPHSSVLDLLEQELVVTGFAAARDAAEESAKASDYRFDQTVWSDEAAEAA